MDLSPFEFLDRLAALIPPPRKHRHRYHGVFAPNHPLRPAVTAMAIDNRSFPPPLLGEGRGEGAPDSFATVRRTTLCQQEQDHVVASCHHDTLRITWTKLLARVGEVFPLACPNCGGDVRLISFITQPETIRKILTHLGEPLEPSHVPPARGPPVDWGDLVQSFGERELEHASPNDLPMIDIHHRSQPVAHPSHRSIAIPH